MKKIIAVASGKGGVGKSTVAANLAVSLANGPVPKKVALIDVDFYGPSIPTLMGGGELQVDGEERIIPALKYGVKFISIAFFLQNPDDAVVWRGPMFGKAIHQLFHDVNWGEVDICIVDLPPGTGDAQLSLSQMVQLQGAVVVTTPQEVALADVRRAIKMFEKVNVDVLGIVENMSGFTTPSGELLEIFGSGGGEELAATYKLPLLGKIPLDVAIRQGGDQGEPIALSSDTASAQLFANLSASLLEQLDAKESAEPALKIVN